ncbi:MULTISPECIES: hypothetical protein [unclassified Streptomyces]|uniref:hypothetical protein n=1 Tax=Streptomyces sp. NPDC055082 TaxID=3365718 RepID=UPI0037D64BFE
MAIGQLMAKLRRKIGLSIDQERASARAEQLTAIGEDGNRPWSLDWQHHHRIRAGHADTEAGGSLPVIWAGALFEGDDIGKWWLGRQRKAYTWARLSAVRQERLARRARCDTGRAGNGPGDSTREDGSEMLPLDSAGGAAAYALAPADFLAAAPRTTELVDAVALPLTGLAARQTAFELAGLKPGQTALVNGAGGRGGQPRGAVSRRRGDARDRRGRAAARRPPSGLRR